MTRPVVIGVMGAGDGACLRDLDLAESLGSFIASRGWVTLSGGRDAGVMAAVNRGARSKGGLTIGILPGSDRRQMAEDVLVPVITNMGNGRNNINVLSSDVVVVLAFGAGAGTFSELFLALKAGKPVIVATDLPGIRSLLEQTGPWDNLLFVKGFEAVKRELDRQLKTKLDGWLKLNVSVEKSE